MPSLEEIEKKLIQGDARPGRIAEWRVCPICEKDFFCKQSPSDILEKGENAGRWCSRKCFNVAQRKDWIDKECPTCHNIFVSAAYKKRIYCSRQCGDFSKRNKKPWNFGSSISRPVNKLIKRQKEYRVWRDAVLSRTRGMCTRCNGKATHAHHILFLNLILEKFKITTIHEAIRCQKLWDRNNGAALCKDCHTKLHSLAPAPVAFLKSGAGFTKIEDLLRMQFKAYTHSL